MLCQTRKPGKREPGRGFVINVSDEGKGRGLVRCVLQIFIPITDPVNRMNQLALGQQLGELAPEFFHMTVDGAVGDDPLVPIDTVHQPVARKDPAGRRVQRLQQGEFHRCQLE